MRGYFITFAIVGFFIYVPLSQAAMSSTNYKIRWDTLNAGGSDAAASASYNLRDTVEPTIAGTGTSASYQLQQGYRGAVDDQVLIFEVKAQDTSNRRAATSLSGLTVTTSTSSIAVNDLIAVAQDLGASQITAIGRVASIGVGTLTVDEWKNAGTQPTIDGVNDYLFPLTASSIALGNLSATAVVTGVIAFEVSAANDNGYVVQILDDGNLRSGSNDVDDISDGTVTVASEEYGARSSDTTIAGSTFDSADTSLTTTASDVATEGSSKMKSRNFLTLKAAISSLTSSSDYTQTISLIASGNF